MLVASLLVISIAILVVAFVVWRATSSRPTLISGIIGSLLMLVAARHVATRTNPDMAIGLPILTGMLLMGRAIGTGMRIRKDPQFRAFAVMWFVMAAACLGSAAWIYFTFP
jgi:hypothetical protein